MTPFGDAIEKANKEVVENGIRISKIHEDGYYRCVFDDPCDALYNGVHKFMKPKLGRGVAPGFALKV